MDPDQERLLRVFQNPVIFDIVSGYLDLEDLKRFRCVNKDVNEACLPVILKRAKAMHLSWYLITVKNEISKLISVISNSSGFPCSKFILGTGVFSQQQLGDDLLLDNFLLRSAISAFVTELELEKTAFDRSFYCKKPSVKVQFEQLQTLKIVYNGTYQKNISPRGLKSTTLLMEDRNKDLDFFTNLLKRCPNLTTLHFESQEEKVITPCLEVMRVSQWNKLRSLSLTGMIKSRHFKILTQLELKLKSFSVSLHPGSIDTIPMSFLESQSSTLEKLTIKWPERLGLDSNCDFRFPRMSKLKMLNAEGLYFQKNIRFPGISFVEQFPALKHLELLPNSKDFFPSEMQPLTTVTTLELPGPKVTPEVVKQTARVFPGVKTLSVCGQLNILQSVNAHMTNVTELVVSGDWSHDLLQVLSGYTKAELSMQKSRKQNLREINLEERQPLPIFKRLQVLRLRRVLVDDFMCEHGLLNCASLVILDLTECELSWISEGMLARMRQQFKVHVKPGIAFW